MPEASALPADSPFDRRRLRFARQWLAFLTALAISIFGFCPYQAQAAAPETKATEALIVDAETGTVLYAKNPDKPIAPAALAKLMSMELVFHRIRTGELALDREFQVSENAWRTGGAPSGGSTMFAALKSRIRLVDLIQGVIVQSANDGCIVIAEGLSGTESKFAEQMTARAREIGLKTSSFKNCSGLPADGQVVTVRELVQLANHIRDEYPQFYPTYAQPDFTWNGITQRNRNPLLAMGIGADGMATGYTDGSGYAIVGSAVRDGRRVTLALSGMASEQQRAAEARRLIEWSLTALRRMPLFAADEVVGTALVYGGAKSHVSLSSELPIAVFAPADNSDQISVRIVYEGPISAPVVKGTPVGTLQVWLNGTLSQETPLYAAESVPVGSIHRRAFEAAAELLTGWLR